MNRRWAIWRSVRPSATRTATSRSRRLRRALPDVICRAPTGSVGYAEGRATRRRASSAHPSKERGDGWCLGGGDHVAVEPAAVGGVAALDAAADLGLEVHDAAVLLEDPRAGGGLEDADVAVRTHRERRVDQAALVEPGRPAVRG